jgi:hypothetical protein
VTEGKPEPPKDARASRLARNEVFFREANELLEREAELYGRRGFEIICECSTAGCVGRMTISRADYEHARSRPEWFIVAPGHEDPSVEDVVERRDVFFLVEKRGVAGAVAREEDPR